MSGWGCRHQLDDRCLLLRKECKPGIPGCVLYRKVTFISEVEREQPKKPPRKRRKRPFGKAARPLTLALSPRREERGPERPRSAAKHLAPRSGERSRRSRG